MSQVIGVDLGGTNLRMALVNRAGRLVKHCKVPVGSSRSEEAIVSRIAQGIDSLCPRDQQKTLTVAIGVPGIVSGREGVIYSSPHFPQWKNFKLTARLSRKTRARIIIDNDANMQAVGEAWKGSGKNLRHFLMVTLGTGIGGGMIVDGKIFQGTNGFTGEWGHMVIETEGPSCHCGSHGCFETFASASAFPRLLRETVEEGEAPQVATLEPLLQLPYAELPKTLFEMAKKGNQAARFLYERMGYYLGIGFASLVNATGIQHLIIGGGLAGAHPFFMKALKKELKNRTYKQTAKGVDIRMAKLGDDAGILGSAYTAMKT